MYNLFENQLINAVINVYSKLIIMTLTLILNEAPHTHTHTQALNECHSCYKTLDFVQQESVIGQQNTILCIHYEKYSITKSILAQEFAEQVKAEANEMIKTKTEENKKQIQYKINTCF